jgi:hypothetical protein
MMICTSTITEHRLKKEKVVETEDLNKLEKIKSKFRYLSRSKRTIKSLRRFTCSVSTVAVSHRIMLKVATTVEADTIEQFGLKGTEYCSKSYPE